MRAPSRCRRSRRSSRNFRPRQLSPRYEPRRRTSSHRQRRIARPKPRAASPETASAARTRPVDCIEAFCARQRNARRRRRLSGKPPTEDSDGHAYPKPHPQPAAVRQPQHIEKRQPRTAAASSQTGSHERSERSAFSWGEQCRPAARRGARRRGDRLRRQLRPQVPDAGHGSDRRRLGRDPGHRA